MKDVMDNRTGSTGSGQEYITIVMAGHVDHGKSTVLGRMLADTDSLPKGKLAKVKAECRKNAKPFEYAFLIDALKEERSQGITIDSARVFFQQGRRNYLITDAPGHIDFLKNMVTGAARANCAFLVIDAKEGVQQNSRRHGFLLSMLGIRQVVVLVNKMDLAGYDQDRFEQTVDEYSSFMEKIGLEALEFIPVSGINGDNITGHTGSMTWYTGRTMLQVMQDFKEETPPVDRSFRMPVQDVYKFTAQGDDRRIIAGSVTSGSVRPGDEIIFYPSGKKSTVKSIEGFNEPEKELSSASAGKASGITLREQIYVKRGDIAAGDSDPRPCVTTRLKASLFWLSPEPMTCEKDYILKAGTARVRARLESIEKIMDTSRLDTDISRQDIGQNMFAECVLKTRKAVAFDLVRQFQKTSRFVIVDDYKIAGGGIIRDALPDEKSWIRDKVLVRDYKWQKSGIPREKRTRRYGQDPAMVFITGEKDTGKKPVAKHLEKHIFSRKGLVYFLGIGNVLYGIDADIKGQEDVREEHLRRLAEMGHIMLDAGMVLIVTAIGLTRSDLELVKTDLGKEKVLVAWTGRPVTTDIEPDLVLDDPRNTKASAEMLMDLLADNGVFPKDHTDSKQ